MGKSLQIACGQGCSVTVLEYVVNEECPNGGIRVDRKHHGERHVRDFPLEKIISEEAVKLLNEHYARRKGRA